MILGKIFQVKVIGLKVVCKNIFGSNLLGKSCVVQGFGWGIVKILGANIFLVLIELRGFCNLGICQVWFKLVLKEKGFY